eukprot:762811-Hanusia_phi.AAC.2
MQRYVSETCERKWLERRQEKEMRHCSSSTFDAPEMWEVNLSSLNHLHVCSSSPRFLLVASSLAICAVIALFALASDQYQALMKSGNSELEQVNYKAVAELQQMLKKQSAMDVKEAQLFQEIQTSQKKSAVHAAALKKAASLSAPSGAVSLGMVSSFETRGPEMTELHMSKVERLKKELAEAEKQEAAKKQSKAAKKANAAKPKSATQKLQTQEGKLVTAAEFKKLNPLEAKKEDNKIAKEAGMKSMGWMGSKSYIDNKVLGRLVKTGFRDLCSPQLKSLNCDPTNFVCTGTPEQKKEALKMIKQIMKGIQGDSKQVPCRQVSWCDELNMDKLGECLWLEGRTCPATCSKDVKLLFSYFSAVLSVGQSCHKLSLDSSERGFLNKKGTRRTTRSRYLKQIIGPPPDSEYPAVAGHCRAGPAIAQPVTMAGLEPGGVSIIPTDNIRRTSLSLRPPGSPAAARPGPEPEPGPGWARVPGSVYPTPPHHGRKKLDGMSRPPPIIRTPFFSLKRWEQGGTYQGTGVYIRCRAERFQRNGMFALLFDLEDYATTYRATRDAYLKAANELKLATGPYKAARDAYVAATATYTKSLYERTLTDITVYMETTPTVVTNIE